MTRNLSVRQMLAEDGYPDDVLDAMVLLWESPHFHSSYWNRDLVIFHGLGMDVYEAFGARLLDEAIGDKAKTGWGLPQPSNPPQ